ncbi:hypothetical protein EmuJ_000092700 [Echinococcus multilocularis]|uniref:Uncharacterized protein n=1 Tax=Echinococcus multilocularis TaxID=6211 RepID=A0A087VY92_ECHMU|nr:hypothetical protein EmuJ_000092700 [Echinococcus multilocularis]
MGIEVALIMACLLTSRLSQHTAKHARFIGQVAKNADCSLENGERLVHSTNRLHGFQVCGKEISAIASSSADSSTATADAITDKFAASFVESDWSVEVGASGLNYSAF